MTFCPFYIFLSFFLIFLFLCVIGERVERDNFTSEFKKNRPPFGIVFTRHVNSEETNAYWQLSIKKIRQQHGPELPIVIIDDNSNPAFVSKLENDKHIQIVNSEYPGRGEILPYYYLYKHHWFDRALILHDSVFCQTKRDFSEVDDVALLWIFHHFWNVPEKEKEFIHYLKKASVLTRFYEDQSKWNGCFGGMSVVTHSFLCKVQKEYNLFVLINQIKDREDRKCFERIWGLICYNLKKDHSNICLYGFIYEYIPWGTEYNYYKEHEKEYKEKEFVKIWTGR